MINVFVSDNVVVSNCLKCHVFALLHFVHVLMNINKFIPPCQLISHVWFSFWSQLWNMIFYTFLIFRTLWMGTASIGTTNCIPLSHFQYCIWILALFSVTTLARQFLGLVTNLYNLTQKQLKTWMLPARLRKGNK